jgi:hypothetical protein
MADEQFFETATEGADVPINVDKRTLEVAERKFQFQLSQMEEELQTTAAFHPQFNCLEIKFSKL